MFSLILAALISPAAAAASPAGGNARAQPNPNERICVENIVTGSRLATEEICRTRAEWARIRRDNMDAVQRAQVERGMMAPLRALPGH